MTTLLRLPALPILRFAFVAAVVSAAACGSRSVIGQQNGGHGGTGGGNHTAGTSGSAGTWGNETAGTNGWGGTWGFDTAGTSGSAGSSAGTNGWAGTNGSAGGTGNEQDCPQQPGGSGGSSLAFTSVAQYPTYRSPQFVALGDLDGDGKLDFAASNFYTTDQQAAGGAAGDGSIGGNGGQAGAGGTVGTIGAGYPGSVSVFLSSDNHATPHNYIAGVGPGSLAIGDLNGDGKADLATANLHDVSILFNSGGGNLSPAVNFSTGINPAAVALADLNHDGKTDMVIANRGMATGDLAGTIIGGDVAVLRNMGSGTFVATNYEAGTSPVAVALAVLDQGGHVDIAVASGNGVSVLMNDSGTGNFVLRGSYGSGTKPAGIAVGDLNGDGHPDIAVANTSIGGASVLLNLGSGTFAAAINYAYRYPFGVPFSIAIGDLNGDGRPDLASTSNYCRIAVLLNAGSGAFGSALPLFAGPSPLSVALGDLNGDNKLDIFVTNSEAVGVLQNLR